MKEWKIIHLPPGIPAGAATVDRKPPVRPDNETMLQYGQIDSLFTQGLPGLQKYAPNKGALDPNDAQGTFTRSSSPIKL